MNNRRLVPLATALITLGVAASPPRNTPPVVHAPARILVYHDMEGLAGQDDWRSFLFSHPEKYPGGQKLLAADLNAVIDGLFAGGATQVDVVDAHGSGNPEPDVRRDLLDPRAKQVFRDKPFDPYVDITEPNTYDAVVAVAMHAKTGKATSASTVELRPVNEVHAEMRAKAARAVRNMSKARVMRLKTPLRAGLHAAPPASLGSLKGVPGISYKDNTVTFSAPDFRAAYDGVLGLVTAARASYLTVLRETVRALPDGPKILADYSNALFMRWMDYESGRWRPPPPTAQTGKTFHGDR